jgi:hypothetical protein
MAYNLISGKMSPRNFALGCAVRSETGSSDDPLVWTPSAVKAEIARIRGVLDTINLEMSQALKDGKVSNDEWKNWKNQYLSAHKFLDKASSLWGSNVIAARQHEQDALKWRSLITSRGGQIMGPADLGRKPEPFLSTTTLALAAGGIAATAMLINAIRKR